MTSRVRPYRLYTCFQKNVVYFSSPENEEAVLWQTWCWVWSPSLKGCSFPPRSGLTAGLEVYKKQGRGRTIKWRKDMAFLFSERHRSPFFRVAATREIVTTIGQRSSFVFFHSQNFPLLQPLGAHATKLFVCSQAKTCSERWSVSTIKGGAHLFVDSVGKGVSSAQLIVRAGTSVATAARFSLDSAVYFTSLPFSPSA